MQPLRPEEQTDRHRFKERADLPGNNPTFPVCPAARRSVPLAARCPALYSADNFSPGHAPAEPELH